MDLLLNKIYEGSALNVLNELPENSVNMCVTSPPYWGLRDYQTNPAKWNDGWSGELGAEAEAKDYINHLCDIFDGVKRVLREDGTCWVNIGDTYKKKCLCMIPFLFALEMVNRGWILRNVIIWHKPRCVPLGVKDRFTVDFEYIFFFSKKTKYYFEQQLEPFKSSTLKHTAKCSVSEKSKYYQGFCAEHQRKYQQKLLNNELKGRNKRTVWSISPQSFHGDHTATYPLKLIETPIKAGCPENGVVLDPFIGSGTTAMVAEQLNRNWVGIELNPKYIEMAEERIRNARP